MDDGNVKVNSITNVEELANEELSQTMSDKCPTCGRFYHPIVAVRDLDPELEVAFPIPEDSAGETKKKRRVIRTARHMTSESMMEQVRQGKCKLHQKKNCETITQ